MEQNQKVISLIDALKKIEHESRLSIARDLREQTEKDSGEEGILKKAREIADETHTTIDGRIEALLVEGVVEAYITLNYIKARDIFLKAARIKDTSISALSYLFLSNLYENNLFQNEMHYPDENQKIAVYYCSVAAVMGNAEGQRRLGGFYANGYSVQENSDNAVRWYKTASDGQDPQADFDMAKYLFNKSGTSRYKEVMRYLKKAADRGNAEAQAVLARELLGAEGAIGGERDQKLGQEYLEKAIRQNNTDALSLQVKYQKEKEDAQLKKIQPKQHKKHPARNVLYVACCAGLIMIGNYRLTNKVFIQNMDELSAGLTHVSLEKSKLESESADQSESQAQSESAAQSESQAQSESAAQSESQAQSESAAQSESQAQSESAAQSESQAQSEAAAQSDQAETAPPITYNMLVENPDAYVGKTVEFTGSVYYVDNGYDTTEISFSTDNGDVEGAIANSNLPQKVLQNDIIHVKGTFSGIDSEDFFGDPHVKMHIDTLEFENGVQEKTTEGTPSYAELERYPNENVGRRVEFTGSVYYTNEDYDFVNISFRTDDGRIEGTISRDKLPQRVLEDDTIHVTGTFSGVEDDEVSTDDPEIKINIDELEFMDGIQPKTTADPVPIEEIERYPDDCVGRKVELSGSVYYIENDGGKTVVSFSVDRGSADRDFLDFDNYTHIEGTVDSSGIPSGLNENSNITITGTFTGLKQEEWSINDGDTLCVDIENFTSVN